MDIKFRSNQILLLGDTHSYKRTYMNLSFRENLDGFDIVFMGDGGEGVECDHSFDAHWLQKISNTCKKRDIRFFAIRGNHSDPSVWERGYKFDNLFLVPDYSFGIFPNGLKSLFVGGGISIDRTNRVEGYDYWSNENTIYSKIEEEIPILFCHDAPDYFNNPTNSLWGSRFQHFILDDAELLADCLIQREIIGKIVSDIKPKQIYGGHFHNSKSEELKGIKYRCLDINELLMIDADSI